MAKFSTPKDSTPQSAPSAATPSTKAELKTADLRLPSARVATTKSHSQMRFQGDATLGRAQQSQPLAKSKIAAMQDIKSSAEGFARLERACSIQSSCKT